MENLIAVGSPSKSFFLSKAGRRLLGFMKYRIGRSSRPWVQIKLDEFAKLSGISRRTLERQLEKIRICPQTNVVVRVIHEDRRWKILASTSDRLYKLKRTEPFTRHESGKNRIVKIRKSGAQLNEEQLVLGKQAIYYKAKPSTDDSKSNVPDKEPANNPAQTTFFGKLNEPTSNRRFSFISKMREQQVVQRKKHHEVAFNQRLMKLSFFMARNDIQKLKWDNCKVAHSMPHAVSYCYKALKLGCNRRTIVKAYEIALHEIHAEAVDQGETESGIWMPSSTIHRARNILSENECHGKFTRISGGRFSGFNSSSAVKTQMHHWSGVN
jgi:hypothetical protein